MTPQFKYLNNDPISKLNFFRTLFSENCFGSFLAFDVTQKFQFFVRIAKQQVQGEKPTKLNIF